jgi:stage III sporulation protein AE
MQYLMYRGVAVLAAVCTDSGLSGLLEELSGAFGLVLGMTGACALMVLISLLAAMSASLPT